MPDAVAMRESGYKLRYFLYTKRVLSRDILGSSCAFLFIFNLSQGQRKRREQRYRIRDRNEQIFVRFFGDVSRYIETWDALRLKKTTRSRARAHMYVVPFVIRARVSPIHRSDTSSPAWAKKATRQCGNDRKVCGKARKGSSLLSLTRYVRLFTSFRETAGRPPARFNGSKLAESELAVHAIPISEYTVEPAAAECSRERTESIV